LRTNPNPATPRNIAFVALGAVSVGAALFGPIGAIFGIPLTAIIILVLRYSRQMDAVMNYPRKSKIELRYGGEGDLLK
jgi:predicted ABC-type sugar transport system permease subunit